MHFVFLSQKSMQKSMAVCTQTLHVIERRFVLGPHLADVSCRVMDFDTSFRMLSSECGNWIQLATLAGELSVKTPKLRLFSFCQIPVDRSRLRCETEFPIAFHPLLFRHRRRIAERRVGVFRHNLIASVSQKRKT